MNKFSSMIHTEYKDGKARTTVTAEKDGEKFTRVYDAMDPEAEEKATKDLAAFLNGTVSSDDGFTRIEINEPDEEEDEEEETETASADAPFRIRKDDEVEKLLNRAGNTALDADGMISDGVFGDKTSAEKLAELGVGYTKTALAFMGKEFPTDTPTLAAASAIYGLHLTNLIDRLCWALDNTLNRYEKLKYRLNSWGDIKYVADVEAGKI